MTVALYTHQDMFDHRPGEGHPESPERLRAVSDALSDSDLDLAPNDAPLAEAGDLLLAHDEAYVQLIERAAPASGLRVLDPDTYMSSGSLTAARRAALRMSPASAPSESASERSDSSPSSMA